MKRSWRRWGLSAADFSGVMEWEAPQWAEPQGPRDELAE